MKNCLQIYLSSSHHSGIRAVSIKPQVLGYQVSLKLPHSQPCSDTVITQSSISTFFTHLPPLILNVSNPQAQVTQGSAKFFCKGQTVNTLGFTGHKAKSRMSVGT